MNDIIVPQGGLPCGIEVRTSSPVLSQPLITEQSNTPVPPAVLSDSRASASLQLYAPQTEVGVDPQTVISTTSILISNTGKTPWVSLCGNLRCTYKLASPLQHNWAAANTRGHHKQYFSNMESRLQCLTHGTHWDGGRSFPSAELCAPKISKGSNLE